MRSCCLLLSFVGGSDIVTPLGRRLLFSVLRLSTLSILVSPYADPVLKLLISLLIPLATYPTVFLLLLLLLVLLRRISSLVLSSVGPLRILLIVLSTYPSMLLSLFFLSSECCVPGVGLSFSDPFTGAVRQLESPSFEARLSSMLCGVSALGFR